MAMNSDTAYSSDLMSDNFNAKAGWIMKIDLIAAFSPSFINFIGKFHRVEFLEHRLAILRSECEMQNPRARARAQRERLTVATDALVVSRLPDRTESDRGSFAFQQAIRTKLLTRIVGVEIHA